MVTVLSGKASGAGVPNAAHTSIHHSQRFSLPLAPPTPSFFVAASQILPAPAQAPAAPLVPHSHAGPFHGAQPVSATYAV